MILLSPALLKAKPPLLSVDSVSLPCDLTVTLA